MSSMAHAAGHAEIKNPGTYSISGSLRGIFIVFILIGIAAFATGLSTDPARTWFSYVMNHFYFMNFAIGGLFFAAIQWLTGAMWSAPIRRIAEAYTAYLPVLLISTIGLSFGIHHLYHWSHADVVANDAILQGKSAYLNTMAFVIRDVLIVLIWGVFAKLMIGNSLAQDQQKGDYKFTAKNRVLAPIFLIFFSITYTIISFDQIMSLDAHWFSTMFGVYCFAGMLYSIHAMNCLLSIILRRKGHLHGIVNENHLHDMGKFMFAFTVFWAYIGFSQFMLIWYANLPEETGYYIERVQGGWMAFTIILFLKFLVPFFVLLPRVSKRSESVLIFVSLWMLFFQWIDMVWMVQPQFSEHGPKIGFPEIGLFLGFLGLFGMAVSWFMSRHNVVAIGDPRLEEAVHHHHQ